MARTGARLPLGADGDLAEVEPECAGTVTVQRNRNGDGVVVADRFLDEADHLAIVDLRETQIAGLQQGRVLAPQPVQAADVSP